MRPILSLATLLIGTSLPALVHAQTQTDAERPAPAESATAPDIQSGLQDIVVTANRREESLQAVPLAVTALSAETLAAKGITSLESLTTSPAPGLIVIPFAGQPTTLSVNMRGVSTPSPADGLVEQGVAIYLDGVPVGRATGAGIELADIERIEVLRGPQGTLFGRNAEGGAVQFISKRPSGKFGGKFEAHYGNYDSIHLKGSLDIPLGETFAFKVAGLYDDRDGFVKNLALRPGDTLDPARHHDLGEFNQKAFRVSALWTPSDAFDAYYTYDYADTTTTSGYIYRRLARANSEPAFCSNPAFAATCAPAVFVSNIYKNRTPAQVGFISVTDLPYNAEPNKIDTRGHGLTLTYRASDTLTFKSITGYRTLKENSRNNLQSGGPFVQFIPVSVFDGIGTDVPVGTLGAVGASVPEADVDQEQFSQEFQVIGNLGSVQFTGGVFYYYEKVVDTRQSFFNLRYFYQGTPGVLVPVVVNPFELAPSKVTYRGQADSYAAYAQATWAVPGTEDRLKLTGGIRYTDDTKKFVRLFYLTGADNSRAQFKDSRFDPAVTVAYQLTDDINLYGRYASAYRAGGVPIRNKLALTTYGAEVNKSFELGFKSQFLDRRVRLNVAAFRSRVKGEQISTPNIITDPSSQDYVNIPQTVKIWGIESELTVAPTRGLTFGANYAYLHVDGPPTVATARGPLPFLPPNAPKHTFTATADYETPISGDTVLKAHVDYNYISGYTLSPLLQPNTALKNIGLHGTNARLGVDDIPLGGAELYVGVFGRNIFDVADDAFTFATGTNDPTSVGGFANAVDRRTYGLEARLRF